MLLYLVRHGETDWNRQRRIQGSTDIPLNDVGRRQAQHAGRLLSRMSWDAVYASPLSRAMETGSLIASELGLTPPIAMPAVIERNYGAAEGLSYPDMHSRFPDSEPVPGRESREAVAARVVPALMELARHQPESSLVIVSHGGAIRAVLAAVDPTGEHPAIANGSIHSFRYVHGSLSLIEFDDPIDLASTDRETTPPTMADEKIAEYDGQVQADGPA